MHTGFDTFRRALRRGVVSLLAVVVVAQGAGAQEPTRKPARGLISINPLGLPFEYFSGETENKLTNLATLGTSISYVNIDDVSYLSVDVKLRLYPNEEAFKGFSLGVAGGFSRLSEDISGGDKNTASRPTLSVLADYNWLLGKSKRVVVGTGVGAKRIFGNEDDFFNANFAYPTARFQVGLIF